MPTAEPQDKQAWAALMKYATGLLEDGLNTGEVRQRLLGRGVSPAKADEAVQELNQVIAQRTILAGLRSLAIGIGLFLVAAAIATNTFGLTDALGTFGYVVAAIALILCLRPFIRGLQKFFGGLWMWK